MSLFHGTATTTPSILVKSQKNFEVMCCFQFQGKGVISQSGNLDGLLVT
jgi:hypothetical protein